MQHMLVMCPDPCWTIERRFSSHLAKVVVAAVQPVLPDKPRPGDSKTKASAVMSIEVIQVNGVDIC